MSPKPWTLIHVMALNGCCDMVPNNSLWAEHASKLLWLLCDVWGAQFTSQVSSLANNMVKTAAVARPTIMAASAKTCLLPLCPMDRWPSRWAWAKSVGAALSICISMPYDVFWYLMVLLPPTSTIVTLIDDVRTTTHSQLCHNHIFRISNWKFSVDEAQHSTWRVGFFPLGLILLLEHNLILKPSRMSLYFSPYMRAGVGSRAPHTKTSTKFLDVRSWGAKELGSCRVTELRS